MEDNGSPEKTNLASTMGAKKSRMSTASEQIKGVKDSMSSFARTILLVRILW